MVIVNKNIKITTEYKEEAEDYAVKKIRKGQKPKIVAEDATKRSS